MEVATIGAAGFTKSESAAGGATYVGSTMTK